MGHNFGFSFPAIRGIQAGKEYYISMCPVSMIPKLFNSIDNSTIEPELRAQRLISKNRIPVIKNYILNNPDNYVFSSLTASIDGDTEFIPLINDESAQMGTLNIAMNARFVINDGQHRKAAIEAALREKESLGDETISIVFYLDSGLKKSQQMFADLNRYAAKPSTSLNILYDYRDPIAMIIKEFAITSSFYSDLIEMERSTLSKRSRKLFTLSALYYATLELLTNWGKGDAERKNIVFSFWEDLAMQFKEWHEVKAKNISAGEVREQYLHCYGVFLQAFGRIGSSLHSKTGKERLEYLRKLKTIDFSRKNIQLWEGRVLIGGKISKNRQNIILISNVMKQKLGLPLSDEESVIETAFLKRAYDE